MVWMNYLKHLNQDQNSTFTKDTDIDRKVLNHKLIY